MKKFWIAIAILCVAFSAFVFYWLAIRPLVVEKRCMELISDWIEEMKKDPNNNNFDTNDVRFMYDIKFDMCVKTHII